MEKTWRPLTAGVLNIIAGVAILFVCFWLALAGGITSVVGDVPQWVPVLLFALAIPFALMSILAVIGGIYAIKRKVWGLALAGSIASFFCFFVMGAIAIILVAISRSEFQ